MGYVAQPETLLTPEYGCRGSQRARRVSLTSYIYFIFHSADIIVVIWWNHFKNVPFFKESLKNILLHWNFLKLYNYVLCFK